MTYTTLQTSSNDNPPVAKITNFQALDDASVAKQIADFYVNQGLDPRAAYDDPDDAIADFGGPGAFI